MREGAAVESPPFPFEPASENRARRALAAAIRRHEEMQSELDGAIAECVGYLRSSGMPPEAMLVTMKAFVRHVAGSNAMHDRSSPVARPIMEQIVEMCIAEYFREMRGTPLTFSE